MLEGVDEVVVQQHRQEDEFSTCQTAMNKCNQSLFIHRIPIVLDSFLSCVFLHQCFWKRNGHHFDFKLLISQTEEESLSFTVVQALNLDSEDMDMHYDSSMTLDQSYSQYEPCHKVVVRRNWEDNHLSCFELTGGEGIYKCNKSVKRLEN